MAKHIPTQNYKLMFESAVSVLQSTYSEYKKAKYDWQRKFRN